MAWPKFQWMQVNQNAESEYAKMRDMVFIQKQKLLSQRTDAAGGTPPDFIDYLKGSDGIGINAEIREPSGDALAIAGYKGQRLTHTIKMRYDSRVKTNMQVRYTDEYGTNHYCTINTITPVQNRKVWMILGCYEETKEVQE